MRRALILGPGGAGKSELARQISSKTGLPVTHLDVLFWQEGWTPAPRDEAVAQLASVVATDRWIIDGNFLKYADADGRFERADTVIFLDLPRATCLWRITKRLVRDRNRRRPDLPDGCQEGFDPDGIKWIWNYRRRDRPQVMSRLDPIRDRAQVLHLMKRADVRKYLDSLTTQHSYPRSDETHP